MPQTPERSQSPLDAGGRPASSRRAWYRTKTFQLILGTAVTIGCLWWAVHVMADGQPLSTFLLNLREAFKHANYLSLPLILALLYVFYRVKAWRWTMLLVPLGEFSTGSLFPPVMIGFAFNNLLPAHLGDFVRVFVFSRQQREPLSAVLASVVLERVLDAIAILTLLGVGLLFMPGMEDPRLRTTMGIVAAGICVALIGAAAYLIWTRPFVAAFEWCLDRVPLLPASFKTNLATMLEQGAAGLASLKHRHLWVGLLFTSYLQWSINVLVISLSLWSFGIRVSPLVSCIVMGVTAFGVTVPASPGYFGVIQLCFVAVLQFFTEDTVGVGAASIYYHLAQWVPVTAIGMYYFWRTGLQMAEVNKEAT